MKLENYLFNPATQKWDLTKETLDLRHYNKGKGLKEDFKTKINLYWEKQKKAPKSFKELIKDPFYCTIIQ